MTIFALKCVRSMKSAAKNHVWRDGTYLAQEMDMLHKRRVQRPLQKKEELGQQQAGALARAFE